MYKSSEKQLDSNNIFKKGVSWNVVSFGVVGVLTAFVYGIISGTYGATALGTYSLALTIFSLLGRVGVCGQQTAIVYFLAQNDNLERVLSAIFVIVTVISVFVSTLTYMCSRWVAQEIFHNAYLGKYLEMVAPAIVLFSINKFLLGYLNGQKRMKEYAIIQMLRYIIIVVYILIIVLLGFELEITAFSFLLSEIIVSLLLFLKLKKEICWRTPRKKELKRVFAFGSKAMLTGIVAEINTKIDVLMIGMFCTSMEVGIYSYISLFVTGIIGVLNVFFVNYNPVFAEIYQKKDMDSLIVTCKKIQKNITMLIALSSVCIIIGYYIMCHLWLENIYMLSILPLIIVLIGMVFMSSMYVCSNVCTQSGKPLWDTITTSITMLVNIIMNGILVPRLGIIGAAGATMISYIIYAVLISVNIKRLTKSFRI